MSKPVYVIIHTRDMDDLDVFVYSSLRLAVKDAIDALEPGDADVSGQDATEALKAWDGKESFDVWEEEGRVAMTLARKEVKK